MYRVLVTACAVGALLSFCVGAAFGQAGTIGIFADNSGSNPFISDTSPGLLNVYVVHVGADGVTACQYRAPKPPCMTATYLADTNPFPVTIGNSQTGVSIGYGACRSGVIYVQTISYFASGTTPPCCHYPVLHDPLGISDGDGIDIVDCNFDPWVAQAGFGIINAEGCDCPQPTIVLNGYESVSWQPPQWTVRVNIQNNGPGPARSVSATMHEDIPWLTVLDPHCVYGQIPAGAAAAGSGDTYTFDLQGSPGGSFNTWFDVSYTDSCGLYHRLRLDPEFDPNDVALPVTVGPGATGLGQNYPNPFNPTTTIPFVLTEDKDVRLSVFDAQGKLVQVLANKTFPAGSHDVIWNGRDSNGNSVASGMYFCRLEAPGMVQTRKLVLLK
jgi:hypothetical protein